MKNSLPIMALLLTPMAAAEEIYQTAEQARILTAARQIIAADPTAALITLDKNGMPRVRTVNASPPEADMTIWIATRPNTRKVTQIKANPKVALYFNDDPGNAYVSVMGTASLHDDLATKQAKNFYPTEELRAFWPQYPDDFLLIKITPD